MAAEGQGSHNCRCGLTSLFYTAWSNLGTVPARRGGNVLQLTNLCAAIDAQSPDIISTVLLMDPDGQRLWPAAGPRVPSGWIRALTPLMIGPDMGSCGTAAFRRGIGRGVTPRR